MTKKIPFKGILAVGDSKREALANYRQAAFGKSVSAYRDGGGSFTFISNASSLSDLFNPRTGDLDLVKSPSLVSKLKFASESSELKIEVNHVVCHSGCGSHIAYDDANLVKFCPVCTSALDEDAEDDSAEDEDGMSVLDSLDSDEVEDDGDVDFDEDGDEGDTSESGDDSDDFAELDEDTEDSDAGSDTSEDAGEDDDSAEDDSEEPLVVAADSKATAIKLFLGEKPKSVSASGLDVDYVVCSNAACAAHIVHELDSLEECPVCHSATEEPESDESEEDTTIDEGDIGDEDISEEGGSKPSKATTKNPEGNTYDPGVDGPLAVAGASKAEATALYLKHKGTSQSGDLSAEYVVCSSAKCGAHIISDEHLDECPACHSSTEEPDEGDDSDFDDADADVSDEDTDTSVDDSSDEDESDDSGASDEDEPIAVAGSSKAEATSLYIKHKGSSQSGTVSADYTVCSSAKCGAHIISDEVLSKCPVCSSDVEEPVEDSDSEINLDDESIEDGDGDNGAADEDTNAGDDGASTEADASAKCGDDTGSDVGDGTGDADFGDDAEDGNDTGANADTGPAEEPEVDDEDADFVEDEGNDVSESSEKLVINSLNYVHSKTADHEKLDVSYSSNVGGQPRWTAYYNGRPVAMIVAADAGKNADLFDEPAFGKACLASAKHFGVKQTLLDMGFKPIVHTVAVSSEMKLLASKKVDAMRKAVLAKQDERDARLMNALSTAFIGINRGFFAEIKTDPLKSALYDVLSTSGVRNPHVLVDKVFSSSFEPSLRQTFTKAKEILAKPAEIQDSLAQTILESNFKAVSSDDIGIEDKLSSLGSAVTRESQPAPAEAQPQVAVASADPDVALAVLSLGKRY